MFSFPTRRVRTQGAASEDNWSDSHGFGYVELQPGADARAVMAKFPALIDRNFDPRKITGLPLRGSKRHAAPISRRSATIIFPPIVKSGVPDAGRKLGHASMALLPSAR